MTTTLKAALHEAKKALKDQTEEQFRLRKAVTDGEARIIQLRRAIVSLSVLCGEPTELESMGLTESVRKIMKSVSSVMTLRHVKEALAAYGFDLSTQKNADAAISTALNRLVEAKEIRKADTVQNGKTVATYAGPKAQ